MADRIATITSPNLLNVTKGNEALTNHDISLEGVAPCQNEEADTRIFVHVRHAAKQGCKSVIIKACDTDVLVIAASVMPLLQNAGLQQLWVAFVQGVNIRWVTGYLYMTFLHQLGLKDEEDCPSFMPSLVVMLSLPSVAEVKNLHGRLGMSVLGLLRLFLSSANTHQP